MSDTIQILFTRTWWSYNAHDGRWFTFLYHWFNIVEGWAWLLFAVLVFRRYMIHRNSILEVCYALAFCTFSASDFCEASAQSSWLIWLKLVNLIILLRLRHTVMTRYYSAAKLY